MQHERGAMLTGLGLGLGAGLMYFLDPGRGRRRRALIRDKVAHTARIGEDAIEATGRDVAHRATGVTARMRRMARRGPVDDLVLVERVRAKLGRYVSHPRAIDADAVDGRVTLRGPILQAEVKRLLKKVNRIPGVREVVSELEAHEEAGSVPALQGGTMPHGERTGIRKRAWSPTMRLLTGTTGMALAGYGASRRDARGAVLAAAGLGLLARAARNLATSRPAGSAGRQREAEAEEGIVAAPATRTPDEGRPQKLEEQPGEVLR